MGAPGQMLFAFGGPTKSRNQLTDAANAIPLRLENGYSVASARTERLSPDANRFPVFHQQRGAARPDPGSQSRRQRFFHVSAASLKPKTAIIRHLG
jgi:hypothetical protein